MEYKYLLPKNKLSQIRSGKRSKEAVLRQKWIDHYRMHKNAAFTARHFGIHESMLWRWIRRYDKGIPSSLENRSRRPLSRNESPIKPIVKERFIKIRQTYPGWGKVKIRVLLKKEGISVGQSRIQRVINEARLKRIPTVKKRIKRVNRKHMYTVPKENMNVPGGLVYMDVKHIRLMNSNRAYQFTAIDHATRKLYTKVYSQINSVNGMKFLQYIEKDISIKFLGTDNGSEFLGKCDQCCEKRGIRHVFSSPRSPKQNPFVERVIQTIINEMYYFYGTQLTIPDQQDALDKYIHIYNTLRPHQSLGYMTPQEKYDKIISADISP